MASGPPSTLKKPTKNQLKHPGKPTKPEPNLMADPHTSSSIHIEHFLGTTVDPRDTLVQKSQIFRKNGQI